MSQNYSSPTAQAVANRLLDWFSHQSRTFLWREVSDPYVILIAEILLRKTGARAVEQFLPGFLVRHPGIRALARIKVDELEAELGILGLSRQRALQLHELANTIVSNFGGDIPSSTAALASLPAVGRYTAGIVAATSFGIVAPAVDTNVARVIRRAFGLIPSHAEARKSANIWAVADELVRIQCETPARITWSMLDLAAKVCTAHKPKCAICPLQDLCVYARDSGRSEVDHPT